MSAEVADLLANESVAVKEKRGGGFSEEGGPASLLCIVSPHKAFIGVRQAAAVGADVGDGDGGGGGGGSPSRANLSPELLVGHFLPLAGRPSQASYQSATPTS